MAVVIDEVESTVEPGGARGAGGESGGQSGDKSKGLQVERLASELRRIEARRQRLKAD